MFCHCHVITRLMISHCSRAATRPGFLSAEVVSWEDGWIHPPFSSPSDTAHYCKLQSVSDIHFHFVERRHMLCSAPRNAISIHCWRLVSSDLASSSKLDNSRFAGHQTLFWLTVISNSMAATVVTSLQALVLSCKRQRWVQFHHTCTKVCLVVVIVCGTMALSILKWPLS
jgi:hypothetical protein